jgi:hypothetical protein
MPYKVTFEPLNRISGVKPTTVEIETAAEAWKTVDGLQRSDEKVTIRALRATRSVGKSFVTRRSRKPTS